MSRGWRESERAGAVDSIFNVSQAFYVCRRQRVAFRHPTSHPSRRASAARMHPAIKAVRGWLAILQTEREIFLNGSTARGSADGASASSLRNRESAPAQRDVSGKASS